MSQKKPKPQAKSGPPPSLKVVETPKSRPNRWLIGGGGLGLAVLGAIFFLFRPDANQPNSADQPLPGLQLFSDLKRDHVDTPINYDRFPPVGGAHSSHWYNSGIYDTQIPLEKVVHLMEHGAVWLTYDPSLSAAEVEQIRKPARGRSCTVVSPFFPGGLKTKVAAVAWGTLLELENADDPRIPRFIAKFERGSQTPEPGATCKGDEGSPIE